MEIKISKEKIEDPEKFIRRCGYGKIIDRRMGQASFIRRLRGDFYPRFHVYINDGGNAWIFNLHLDQKKPSYAGVAAHAGEYEGKVVEEEAKRISNFQYPISKE